MDPYPEQKKGLVLTLLAFTCWGFFPVYFKNLDTVSSLEIVCHRAVWSVLFTALLITLTRGWPGLKAALAERKVLLTLCFSSTLVAVNWFIFIYAVTSGRILQASLGYFINPLVIVFLGMIFLKERLRPLQWTAVGLAVAGTLNQAVSLGALPWISLFLAFSFGFYGLIRKTVHIESLNGLFVETGLQTPAALAILVYLGINGRLSFGGPDAAVNGLILAAGAVNSIPLILFAAGARRIPYSSVGLCQYLTPTLHFLLAVVVYQEAFTRAHLITFSLIWAGLILFAVDLIANQRKIRHG